MKYPAYLKENDTIGLVAPSLGVSGFPYVEKFDAAVRKLTALGYHFKEAESLHRLVKARSTTGRKRAREFMKMYLDDEVDFIFSVAGGELMMEMLPYVDFAKISKARPKYFMGYSDNTCLTFLLTVKCDIASVYGYNFGTFGMREWHRSLKEAWQIISGQLKTQSRYDYHEIEDLSREEGHELDGYNLTQATEYKTIGSSDCIMEGRLIGGCLDVLLELCGTPFGQIDEFLEKYKEDGFIWYLEACDLNVFGITRGLWQLKQAGWFKYCKGFMFGRPKHGNAEFGVTLRQAYSQHLSDLKVPIIYDMDFGHIPPSWAIINGALARIEKKGPDCTITYIAEESK